jgi:hypothetical protein
MKNRCAGFSGAPLRAVPLHDHTHRASSHLSRSQAFALAFLRGGYRSRTPLLLKVAACVETTVALLNVSRFPEGPGATFAVPLRSFSGRRKNVNLASGDEVPRLRGVCGHVRSRGMRFQRFNAFPFLDHHERIRSKIGLELERGDGIDAGCVFDASLLGSHSGDIGAEGLQDGITLPRLGCDYRDNVDHVSGQPRMRRHVQSTKNSNDFADSAASLPWKRGCMPVRGEMSACAAAQGA